MNEKKILNNIQKNIINEFSSKESKDKLISFVPGRIKDYSTTSSFKTQEGVILRLKTTRLAKELSTGEAQEKARKNINFGNLVSWAFSKGIFRFAIPIYLKIKFFGLKKSKYLNWINEYKKEVRKIIKRGK